MSKFESGFTLVELVITILVLAILIAIGIPSFAAVMRSTQVATRANQFMAAVNLARSDAIKNNAGAGICASTTGAACGAATDWNTGWMVYDDANGNGVFDAGDTVLRVDSVANNITFSVTSATPPANIAFNNRGIYRGTAPTPITFKLTPTTCPTGYQGVRNFSLLAVGQIIMSQRNCP